MNFFLSSIRIVPWNYFEIFKTELNNLINIIKFFRDVFSISTSIPDFPCENNGDWNVDSFLCMLCVGRNYYTESNKQKVL